MENYFY